MAEKTNIWDGVVHTGKYSSGIYLYTDTELTVFYVIPLIEGHDYRIVFSESHNRRRVVTTSFDPVQSTGTGIRALVETNSPAVPYELEFTAATNENYLFVYVSNAGETPVISAHDMSIPDYESKHLIRSDSTIYSVADGTLTALSETEITASLFQTYGVDEIPDGSLFVGLTDPEVLYWHDSTDDLPVLMATVTGAPPSPQVVTSWPQDLSHETIKGISHAAVTASTDVLFAISFDGGTTWIAHDGTAWYAVTEETPGMTAEQFNAITAEQWSEVVVLDAYLVRFWLPNITASVTSVVLHYINS